MLVLMSLAGTPTYRGSRPLSLRVIMKSQCSRLTLLISALSHPSLITRWLSASVSTMLVLIMRSLVVNATTSALTLHQSSATSDGSLMTQWPKKEKKMVN